MLHPSAASRLGSLGRLARKSETDPGRQPDGDAVALARGGILRCEQDYERSGANDDADGCRSGAGNCGAGGCGIFVGLLVSGDAAHGDSRPTACYDDALGSAVGAWANLRRESVCDAGFLPAPGDTAFVWAAGWESGGVLLSRMAVRFLLGTVLGDSFAFEPG